LKTRNAHSQGQIIENEVKFEAGQKVKHVAADKFMAIQLSILMRGYVEGSDGAKEEIYLVAFQKSVMADNCFGRAFLLAEELVPFSE